MANEPALTREDREFIRQLVEQEFTEAAVSRDWARVLATLSPDVVYMPADHAPLHGHAAVREWFDQFPTIVSFTQPLEDLEGTGSMAVVRASFAVTVEVGGQRLSNSGKAIGWLVRDAAGTWVMKSVCWNWDRPLG